jgi:hypothetical protein
MPFLKRLLLTSATLNICWAFIGTQIGRLFQKDFGGIIIGLGFLIIYSLTYYFSFDKSKKTIHNLFILTATIIVIFLTASFIPPFLFTNGSTDLSIIGFFVCSSIIAFVCIVAILGHYIEIGNKTSTIVVGSIVTALIAYVVAKYAPEHIDNESYNKVVNPLAVGFCVWQVLTTFLIGRSIIKTTILRPTSHSNKGNKMMPFLTLALALTFGIASGQTTNPSKSDIEKVIKLTITQKMTRENIACEYGQCGEWWTANKDSIFYKSDTVKFYNSSNIVYGDTTFCTSLVWDFENGNAFNDSQAQMCQEPPTRTIKAVPFLSGQKNYVKTPDRYAITSKDDKTFIVLFSDKNVIETFRVIDLTKTTQQNLGDKSYVLTLVRQKFGRR